MKQRLPEYLKKVRVGKLSHNGNSISCSCPLHPDNNPSFSANLKPPGIWLFKCHSCGVGGSIIDLYAASNRLDAHVDFWGIMRRLEEFLGLESTTGLGEQEEGDEMTAHQWLRDQLPEMKRTFAGYLYTDNAVRASFAKLLGLPDHLLQWAASKEVMGAIPAGTTLYTNRGKVVTIGEPRLVYIGRSHLKIRRPFGDGQKPSFMFVGHPSEPWIGETLRDQSFSPQLVHLHESESSALALLSAGFWSQDCTSVVVSGHGANGFKPEWTHLFRDREVHLWPDADAAGNNFVARVSTALSGVARTMVVHNWQDFLKEKGFTWHNECKDVRDAFVRGGAEVLRNVPGTALNPAAYAQTAQEDAPGPSAAGRRMQLVHCNDITFASEPDQLVEGLLTEGSFSVVYGDSNVGKTFFTLALAAAVASGLLIAGRKVRRGPVVYVSMEGAKRFNNRIVALKKTGRLVHDAPFYLASWPLALLEQDKVGEFVNAVLTQIPSGTKPVLIVLDTLSRGMAGGDESSSVDMTSAVAAIDRIRHETGAHCLLVHHCGKDKNRGSRGHTSLRAAIDSEFEVSRDGDDLPFVHNTKQRDLPKAEHIRFRLNQHQVGVDALGNDITTCTVEFIEGAPVEVKKCISKRPAKSPSIDQVCGCLKSEPEPKEVVVQRISGQLELSQRVARTLIDEAVNAGRIRTVQTKAESGQKRLCLCLVEDPARLPKPQHTPS